MKLCVLNALDVSAGRIACDRRHAESAPSLMMSPSTPADDDQIRSQLANSPTTEENLAEMADGARSIRFGLNVPRL